MPEDDGSRLEELVDEALYVDALMGWDGEACRCVECDCPRFVDRPQALRCDACAAGDHTSAAHQGS